MQNSHWHSIRWIHWLYRRYMTRRFLHVACLGSVLALLAFQFLFYSTALFSLQYGAVNFLFVVLTGLVIWYFGDALHDWYKEGIHIRTFLQHWEKQHPDIANRAALLVYAETNTDEIRRLGYSTELIQADDVWLDEYVRKSVKSNGHWFPFSVIALFLAVLIPTSLIWYFQKDHFYTGIQRIASYLWVIPESIQEESIVTDETVSVARGDSIQLSATWSNPDPQKFASVYFRTQSDWNRQSVSLVNNRLIFLVPSVNREMEYYFAAGNTLSNKGHLQPIDPPSLIESQLTVLPPLYTGLADQHIDRLRPLSVPEGSTVSLAAKASVPLVSATLFYDRISPSISLSGDSLSANVKIDYSGDLLFVMQDQNDLIGRSRRYRITSVADATPTLDVIYPKPVSIIPDNMQLKVQLHAHDDYRIEQLFKHVKINGEKPNDFTFSIWANSPIAASETQTAVTTELFVTYDWDLTEYNLFPGDELTFVLEVFDNDALHGPKSAQSQTFVIQYPSLVDLLSHLSKVEEKQKEDLGNLVEQQKQIVEDAKKTIEKIEENKKESEKEGEKSDKQDTWTEQKELENLKERQQDLIEEAQKIEKQLEEYKKQTEEAAKQDEKQQFTPETLEKIAKIQELFKQLVDEDSQALMEKIDQTIDQMSKQIKEEQLKDLNFTFEDFNQQLERTLSMLETAFKARQLDGLKQMADDLVQRQEHLQRETDKLAQEKEKLDQTPSTENQADLDTKRQQLESQQNILETRQQEIQQDTESLLNAMQEMQKTLQETNPEIAQKLEEMSKQAEQQSLKNEMSQASQNMQSGNLKQAQQNQQNAMKSLQQISQSLQDPMMDMGGMNMEMDTKAITRLIRQGLFLSEQMESLTESSLGQSDGLEALRKAQVLQRELIRVNANWQQIAKTNPFMSREVEILLRSSDQKLKRAIESGQGEKWVGLHETRGSMIALDSAIYQMMQDMKNQQQQSSQSQSQGMQQQMQQMTSQQQNLQQMLQQMRQMQEQGGQQMSEQLKQMAEQQTKIRKEIEKMMQQNRHAQQLRNQLDGIYQEMKEAEKMLQEGTNDADTEEKQKKIITRMLEAGSMQEQDDYGQDREAEVAKTGLDSESPQDSQPVPLPDKIDRFVDRPLTESIPLPYREALKKYYIHLAEQVTR